MPDWQKLVRRQLVGLALEPHEHREVVEELAAHLQETYEALRKQGLGEDDAAQRALALAGNWNDLRRRIQAARIREDTMTNRVTQLWLPGALTFVLAEGLLGLLQKFGPQPWIFAWSGHPPVAQFYVPWLLALPFIGAMGAYVAHRAGGSPRAVFCSILFPVLSMLGLFLVAFPVALIVDRHVGHHIQTTAFLLALLGWVLVPGAALLVGGLPVQLFLSRRLPSRGIASN